MITGKLYDYLKWLTQVVLPAIGALYVALAGLWELPSAEEVAGTILAIVTFLGVLLGISQVSYGRKVAGGNMLVDTTGDKVVYSLVVDDIDLDTLADKQEIRLKVRTPPPTR